MKAPILILCIVGLLSSQNILGQFEGKDILVAASLAPYPTSTNDQNDFGILLKGDVEYFATKKLSIVTTMSYSNNTAIDNASGITYNGYAIIPNLQYYILNKKRWSVFVNAGYGLGFVDRTVENSQNSAIAIAAFGAGAQYKIGKRTYLKLQLPYFRAQNISFDFKEVEGVAPFAGISYRL